MYLAAPRRQLSSRFGDDNDLKCAIGTIQTLCEFKGLRPVVKNFVSLTSSLRPQIVK